MRRTEPVKLIIYNSMEYLIGIEIAQSVYLRTGRPRKRGSIPNRGKSNFLLHSVQTGAGIHSAVCPLGIVASSCGHKAAVMWIYPLTSI
jgi:hypothetical protein